MPADLKPYRERLTPPVLWWVLVVLFALSAGVAVGFYLGPVLGLTIGGLALAAGVGLLVSAGTLIETDDRRLRVGRAMIEWPYVGGVHALDEAATARRTGPEADARAYLALRPYVRTAVEIRVRDAADPVPYWLVSTRHPARLAAAVSSSIKARA